MTAPAELLAAHGLPGTVPLHDLLAGRRWFAGGGRRLEGVTVADACSLRAAGPAVVLAILRARYAGGGEEDYSLPLASGRLDDRTPEAGGGAAGPGGGERGPLVDALTWPPAAAVLWELMLDGARLPTCRGELACAGDGLAPLGAGVDLRPVEGEQSNTSLVRDGSEFLKWVRRLEPGPSVEVEMARALTAAGFEQVPAVLGSIEHRAAGGPWAPLCLVQRFLPQARDGWALAVADARAAAGTASFPAEAARLGDLTARLHRALASPAIGPELAPEAFAAGSLERLRSEMTAKLDRLLDRGDPGMAPLAAGREAIVDLYSRLAALAGSLSIRVHGDYHLGQVLLSEGTWHVVDFGGEPLSAAASRRDLSSPLRDVAGMLRSFDYAGAVAAAEPAAASASVTPVVARRWVSACREAFWSSYRRGVAGTPLLPPRPDDELVLRAFEVDKAVYEVGYELAHRPRWAPVPLAFLEEVLDGRIPV